MIARKGVIFFLSSSQTIPQIEGNIIKQQKQKTNKKKQKQKQKKTQ